MSARTPAPPRSSRPRRQRSRARIFVSDSCELQALGIGRPTVDVLGSRLPVVRPANDTQKYVAKRAFLSADGQNASLYRPRRHTLLRKYDQAGLLFSVGPARIPSTGD